MVLNKIGIIGGNKNSLKLIDIPKPTPEHNELLIKVNVCGICHTELDEIEGRTPPPKLPIVPGHQVVGIIEETGPNANELTVGKRVGVAWIYSTCGECRFCRQGLENLCDDFCATGRDANGGYAEYMKVSENFAFIIPENFSDSEAAPLLCAGAIGYRSLRLSGIKDGDNLGLSGFGASGHIVIQMVKHKYPNTNVFVFARNKKEREFAKELGAVWTGDTRDHSPEKLISIIDTTPVWKPVVEALKNLEKSGRLIINSIRKEEVDKDYLLKIDYPDHIWNEKEIKSIANVTRNDVNEFLELASNIGLKPKFQEFDLDQANEALKELKAGQIKGAKVLRIA